MNRLDNSKDSKYGNYVLIAVLCICFIVCTICICWFTFRSGRNNGSSTSQIILGRGVGNFCSSDAMCSSNRCRSSICVL
jgi:hypothetical protein